MPFILEEDVQDIFDEIVLNMPETEWDQQFDDLISYVKGTYARRTRVNPWFRPTILSSYDLVQKFILTKPLIIHSQYLPSTNWWWDKTFALFAHIYPWIAYLPRAINTWCFHQQTRTKNMNILNRKIKKKNRTYTHSRLIRPKQKLEHGFEYLWLFIFPFFLSFSFFLFNHHHHTIFNVLCMKCQWQQQQPLFRAKLCHFA